MSDKSSLVRARRSGPVRSKELVSTRLHEAETNGKLHLQRCTLAYKDVLRITKCLGDGGIHILDVSYCRWQEDGEVPVPALIDLLAACLRKTDIARSLQVLNLSHLSSGNQIAVAIFENLLQSGDSNLRELYLRHTGLTKSGVESLVALWQATPSLQILDLANNRHMGPEGARVLAQGLQKITQCDKKSCSSLRELDLSGCLGDDDGAFVLAAASRLPNLHTLVLNKNCLGAKSRSALTLLLEKCQSLRTLKFGHYGNLVTSAHESRRFAVNLASSRLQTLDLSLYLAEPGSIRRILDTLPSMTSLQELTVFGRAMPLLARVLPKFKALHTLIVLGDDFDWTSSIQDAFYHNRSLHRRINVTGHEEAQGVLELLVERNRALHLWHTSSQSERATLMALWPHILGKLSAHSSSLSSTSCLELLCRGIVE